MRILSAALLFLLFAALVHGADLTGRVSWVYDGDTLLVEPIGKVRLIGIDTPEYQDSSRDRFYAQRFHIPVEKLRRIAGQAKKFGIETVKGKKVRLEVAAERYDKYGRTLAYVYLEDGKMLNRLLLQKGLATVFRRYNFKEKQAFLKIEQQARTAGVGLWAP